ncbi:protein kinase [Spongiactinospora sp. TRM90649]|nr:protein kinase [Spongiactinospora sp. TRM90649]MDF5758371.1 protein kinase [Spongiactinospora sp. TRM90649]
MLDRIGAGGMGTVWRANDQLLNRMVAIKEMHLQAMGKERAKKAARARREAHTIARISHPNVVNVYDLVSEDGRLWLVMEYVDGPSLQQHVAESGPMSPAAVAEVGLQVLSALSAVHAAGALHRDIKPDNLLLRPDERVILCDFGIAALSRTDPITATGAVMGSFGYIAPERLTDEPAGPPSDLFSLGVTLCVLVTGRSPFDRPEAVAVLNAVLREEPNIPDTAGPLRSVIEALVRKDPADRPTIAQATEMLRPLTTRILTTEAQTVTPPPRRRRLLGLAAAASAAVLVAVTGTVIVLTNSPDQEAATGAVSLTKPSTGHPSIANTNPTRIDEVMPVPDDPMVNAPESYWMFSGDRYIRVRLSESGYPIREVLRPPSAMRAWKNTLSKYPGFRTKVDAVLRVPGNSHEYWVFSGKQYLRLKLAGAAQGYQDSLVAGPKPLSDWKNALGDLADNPIDAVMRTPDDPRQYWFFQDGRYVRTTLNDEGPEGHVSYGPAPVAGWPGTFDKFPAFREGIDAAFPVPGEWNYYWVFAGTQYMKIRVTDDAYEDTVTEGPETLRNWAELG